jgi:hypothetical protein
MPSRLSIRLYETRAMTRFALAKAPDGAAVHYAAKREDGGVQGEVADGRWRVLRWATELKYLSTSRVGFPLCSAAVVALGSLLTTEINVMSCPALAKPTTGGPRRTDDLEVMAPAYLVAELARVKAVEARACSMMRQASSCRATCHGCLWRQTLGVAKKICLSAVGAMGLTITRYGALL